MSSASQYPCLMTSSTYFRAWATASDTPPFVFLVVFVIYFTQGLSIVVYFLKARNVQVFFWFVLFILIFVQPLLIGLVAGLGVFDIWADFRKLRKVADIE